MPVTFKLLNLSRSYNPIIQKVVKKKKPKALTVSGGGGKVDPREVRACSQIQRFFLHPSLKAYVKWTLNQQFSSCSFNLVTLVTNSVSRCVLVECLKDPEFDDTWIF